MDKFDKVISLGYICNVAEMLIHLKMRKEAYPFDRLGISAWAVNELLSNNFNEFLEYENLKTGKLFLNSNEIFTYDEKYYVRLENKELNKSQYSVISQKIKTRVERLKNVLDSEQSVLFIRSSEPMENRIILDQYADKYAKPEIEQIRELSNILKTKYPNLKFKILYIGGEFVDVSNNIVGIPVGPNGYHIPKMGQNMKNHIDKHRKFIDKSL